MMGRNVLHVSIHANALYAYMKMIYMGDYKC